MEATGPYHEQITSYLYASDIRISVVNPARIRNFAKSEGFKAKNDRVDAQVNARFGLKMHPPLWSPSPKEYQQLQVILTRLEALELDRQREQNRLEKLEASASPSPQVQSSIHRHLDFLKQEKECLEQQVQELLDSHPQLKKDQKFLCSIPGIGPKVSIWINAVLGNGRNFSNARQVAAYLGVTPTEHRSGTSISKKPRFSKMGPPLVRKKLYMAALVATSHNPDIKALYERLLKKGKAKMTALGAAMRKLVHLCFGVIKHQSLYQANFSQSSG